MMQNDAMGAQWIKDDEDNPVTQLKQWTLPYTTYVGQYTITLDDSTKIGKQRIQLKVCGEQHFLNYCWQIVTKNLTVYTTRL